MREPIELPSDELDKQYPVIVDAYHRDTGEYACVAARCLDVHEAKEFIRGHHADKSMHGLYAVIRQGRTRR